MKALVPELYNLDTELEKLLNKRKKGKRVRERKREEENKSSRAGFI